MNSPKQNPAKSPALGYAILGLLHQKPSSGYDLRKIFSATAMKAYSNSPGAIYPALRRLEKGGLIRGVVEEMSGLRRRQLFRLTPKGLSELRKWIQHPVKVEDLGRRDGDFMLRFAFSERIAGPAASVELLRSLAAAQTALLAPLRQQLSTLRSKMSTSARLALEWGIQATEAWLKWTQFAISTYEKEKASTLKATK
jgi:DNA-binding PadR family transcriptional regulator